VGHPIRGESRTEGETTIRHYLVTRGTKISKRGMRNMNWKVLCLIAGLTLSASLSACSAPPSGENQANPSVSPAAESGTSGDATKSDTTKDATKSDTTKDATKSDTTKDATKKEPATTKP
ncbi:MAG TPA: hypothetical protein V6D48_24540, partial [Oculatellaceae cyanobacterium]